jgi:hypothetical protein
MRRETGPLPRSRALAARLSQETMVRPVIFVHTNPQQMVGALVSAHSFVSKTACPEAFDVRIITTESFPFLERREGAAYRRGPASRTWSMEDLQSFTPLRFAPPALMGYAGRALVVDPDVFAVGDVWELLARPMGEFAILCRTRPQSLGPGGGYASSVMLLDCARLKHWNCEANFAELFDGSRDYLRWIRLEDEPAGSIGPLEDSWNDFDRLAATTRLLHNTRRRTQPWKTGLRIDFQPPERPLGSLALGMLNELRRRVAGEYGLLGRYRPHPDPRQELHFFSLLGECLEEGKLSAAFLENEIGRGHLRRDAFAMIERASQQAAVFAGSASARC